MIIKYTKGIVTYKVGFDYKGIERLLKTIISTKLERNVFIVGLEISEDEIKKIKSDMPKLKFFKEVESKTIFGIDILPMQEEINA